MVSEETEEEVEPVLKNWTVDQLFEEIQTRYTGAQANLLILELRNKLEGLEEKEVETNSPLIDTKWYDPLTIKDSLIKKGISADHILGSVENNEELESRLDGIKGANFFYIIPLNVNAVDGAFNATNHWVGLYITTNEHGQIDSISYINPIGQKINEELQRKILKKTGIEATDLTEGKGVQFAYFTEESGVPELTGNINDCGPLLVQLLTEIKEYREIQTSPKNHEESIAFGQQCRAEQRCNEVLTPQELYYILNQACNEATNYNLPQNCMKLIFSYLTNLGTNEHSTVDFLTGADSESYSDHIIEGVLCGVRHEA